MSAQDAAEEGGDLAQVLRWVLLLLGLGAILMLAREVLVPLALALLMSFALSPVVRALQKVGVPRGFGAVIALTMFMAALAVWVWFVSAQMTDLASKLPAYQHNIHEKMHAISLKMGAGDKSTGVVAIAEDALKEVGPAQASKTENAPQRVVVVDNSPFAQISVLGSVASPVLSPIATFLIVLVFTAFVLAQQEDLRNRAIKLIGPKDIYRTTEAIDDAGRRIGRMLFAQVIMNSTFGFIIAVALWGIGVPSPALWGALAALSRFVPYIGVMFGLFPPLIVAFAFDPGWSSVLMTLGLFVVAEGITGQVIEPIVYGHSSGLSPTAVVVMTAIWGFLWGPIGLVLATPLTTCLVVMGRHVDGLGFIQTLLGDEPPLTAQETFYQRMLAGDPREAAEQAKPYLKRNAIAAYYDEVALDALRRAHVDVARGDLDQGRLDALTQSTEKLVAWLGASTSKSGGWRTALRRIIRVSAPKAGVAAREARQDALLRSHRVVAVLHGQHALDPLAATMLTDALTRRGLPSQIVSTEQANMASATETASVGLICLCFIEPLTMAHLRGAVAMARKRCPQAKVMICVWRDPGDTTFAGRERMLRCDAIATGIGEAGATALRLLGLGSAPWMVATPAPTVRRAPASAA